MMVSSWMEAYIFVSARPPKGNVAQLLAFADNGVDTQ